MPPLSDDTTAVQSTILSTLVLSGEQVTCVVVGYTNSVDVDVVVLVVTLVAVAVTVLELVSVVEVTLVVVVVVDEVTVVVSSGSRAIPIVTVSKIVSVGEAETSPESM